MALSASARETAEAYVLGFDDSFTLIATHPAIGAVHDTVRPPVHSLPHGREKCVD